MLLRLQFRPRVATSTANGLGPALGGVAADFAKVGPVVKWLGIFELLVGRLEIFIVLILFRRAYRRH